MRISNRLSSSDNCTQLKPTSTIMKPKPDSSLDEKIARLDKAVHELIEEPRLPANHQEWLEAAARRAGVNLNEVLPRTH
jgi:hypothetical protein